ncbi:hypothetical protein LZ30DRAFT_222710 [Colletotrichum cereale]|nr:hypothetical protein LZ30DRAFT_222710 [Colletotrichum cereale]
MTLPPLTTISYFLEIAAVVIHTVAVAENSDHGEDCSEMDGAVSGRRLNQGGPPIWLSLRSLHGTDALQTLPWCFLLSVESFRMLDCLRSLAGTRRVNGHERHHEIVAGLVIRHRQRFRTLVVLHWDTCVKRRNLGLMPVACRVSAERIKHEK